jgi:hypothetical protein
MHGGRGTDLADWPAPSSMKLANTGDPSKAARGAEADADGAGDGPADETLSPLLQATSTARTTRA